MNFRIKSAMNVGMITLRNKNSQVLINPYGGQVMSWIHEGRDILWQTTPEHLQAAQSSNKPMRGGIPLCWPWFRGHAALADAPSHGFARTSIWILESRGEDFAHFSLITDGTRADFPYRAKADLHIKLEPNTLHVELMTLNLDSKPFKFSQALHTYLRVDDITSARLYGLENLGSTHISSGKAELPRLTPLQFSGEIEHLYHNVTEPLRLEEEKNRSVQIHNGGCTEAVVWNPWEEKSRGLDMPAGNYRHMLCVEAASIEDAPTLQPGESHSLSTRLTAS